MKMQRDEEDFLHFSTLWALPARGAGDGIVSFFIRPAEEPQRREYPFYLEEDYRVAEFMI